MLVCCEGQNIFEMLSVNELIRLTFYRLKEMNGSGSVRRLLFITSVFLLSTFIDTSGRVQI